MDRLLPWLRSAGWLYGAAAVIAVLIAWRMAGGSAPAPARSDVSAAAQIAVEPSASGPPRVVVHVAGAVRRPGVYRLAEGGRVQAAVARAGGATPSADLSALNLAAPLTDGQQVVVPRRVSGAVGAAGASASGGPISLSSATEADLDELDGIGPTLAARIVAWRLEHGGFASVDQLTEVPGIGDVRLESLRSQVTP